MAYPAPRHNHSRVRDNFSLWSFNMTEPEKSQSPRRPPVNGERLARSLREDRLLGRLLRLSVAAAQEKGARLPLRPAASRRPGG